MQLQRDFYTDPGHGWLAVSYQELVKLGISKDISTCSYFHKGTVYLEEDVDAGVYIDAIKKNGDSICVTEHYAENTPIRGYSYYRNNHNY
ncbi:MAG: hypothetical protein DRO67_00135 [Candidatus Asgardarchaeum californiense]|nr:MAG: hypothetical protein DRO67_00135 [Candidatus Asgardarchaeum californiense]